MTMGMKTLDQDAAVAVRSHGVLTTLLPITAAAAAGEMADRAASIAVPYPTARTPAATHLGPLETVSADESVTITLAMSLQNIAAAELVYSLSTASARRKEPLTQTPVSRDLAQNINHLGDLTR